MENTGKMFSSHKALGNSTVLRFPRFGGLEDFARGMPRYVNSHAFYQVLDQGFSTLAILTFWAK